MKASIIIPCKEVDSLTEKCIEHCKTLDYDNYEIILLPDNKTREIKDVRTIPTGALTPGAKRNIGIKNSSGEILAFIDSDAYPEEDWLKNAVKYFKDPEIAAVGGPGITPKDGNKMQKAGGYVLSSFMVGTLSSRYKTEKAHESDDIHSCNFITRKDVAEKVRWDEKYWPGEDTLICLGIKKMGKQMLEAPDVVVYHHRRSLFIPHLTQVSRFGMHRGFFAKKFPENSFKPIYLMPTLFTLFLLGGIIAAYLYPAFRTPFFIIIGLYALFALLSALPSRKLIPFVFTGIIATHTVYGLYFLIGLAKGDLER